MKTLFVGLIALTLALGATGCKKEVQEAPEQIVKKLKAASIDLPEADPLASKHYSWCIRERAGGMLCGGCKLPK